MRLTKLVLVAALSAAPAMTFAQTTTAEQSKKPIVKHEFNQQQRRIGNGIQNDRLTPRQGARLERQQMRIHRQFRGMRTRHNGRLTMQGAPHDSSPADLRIAQHLSRETPYRRIG